MLDLQKWKMVGKRKKERGRGSKTEKHLIVHVSGKGPFKVLTEEILRLVRSQGVRRVNKTICWQKKMQLHCCGIQEDWEVL